MEVLVCKGQSMFPTLRNGDTLLIKNFNILEIEPFDIVVYKNKVVQVCHRIFKIKYENGKKFFYTKGDFNLFFVEKVQEDNILGKVIGVYRKGRFKSLRLEKTIFYYIFISLFTFLKELLKWCWGKMYNFYSIRLLIKRIAPFDKSYLSLSLSEDEEYDFKSFYNFFPFDSNEYEKKLKVLAKYKNRALGKLWVVKDRKTERFFIYGPYVKIFYRARYIGRDLVTKTIDILKNNLQQNCAYVSIPRYEKSLISFYASFGFTVEKVTSEQNYLSMYKYLS